MLQFGLGKVVRHRATQRMSRSTLSKELLHGVDPDFNASICRHRLGDPGRLLKSPTCFVALNRLAPTYVALYASTRRFFARLASEIFLKILQDKRSVAERFRRAEL